MRDTTVVGRSQNPLSGSAGDSGSFMFDILDTPPAGLHTYSLKAFSNGANAVTLQTGAGGSGNNYPASIRVEKA